MKVLVVGTVPPPGGDAARRLGRIVAARLAAGDEVEILSPDPRSAAHRHARLRGLWLPLRLALHGRGIDALVLDVQDGLPLAPTAGRLTRGATLAALGLALQLFTEVTVRLPSPMPLPGGVGGRSTRMLWSRSTTIVVENDEDRERMLLAPGVVADCVVVEPLPAPAGGGADARWSELDLFGGDLRATVQAAVRGRAARDHEVIAAGRALRGSIESQQGRDPFAGAAPERSHATLVASARVIFARVRRVLERRVLVRRRRAAQTDAGPPRPARSVPSG